MTADNRTFPTARTYAFCSLGVVALTVYGSLVPFEYKPRSFDNAVQAFDWVLHNRVRIESRSDGAANFVLGFPLGFCLLGAMRVDRSGLWGTLFCAAVILPPCLALAAVVEFTQLWFPNRTCSTTDIEAQTLGAAVGMAAWVLVGQRVTRWLRGGLTSDRYGGKAGRLLSLYLFLVFAIQVLPFDVMTSPAEIYRRLRDGQNMTLIPFSEWSELESVPVKQGEKIVAWLRLVGVFLPIGIIAANLLGSWRTWGKLPAMICGAVLVGVGMEAAQIPIYTRHASTTDVIIESASILAGWSGTLALRSWPSSVVNAGFLVGWGAMIAVAGWFPFDFQASAADRVTWQNFIPFLSIESKQYLLMLNEMLEVLVAYGMLGPVVAALTGERKVWVGIFAAGTLAAVIELGQFGLPTRTPATTDVVLAVLGGGLGVYLWTWFLPGRECETGTWRP